MPRSFAILGALATALLTVVGTTVAIDARYAKSAEVQDQFCKARKQTLRDRIFEIDLKPVQSSSDKALREYLSQQLNDRC